MFPSVNLLSIRKKGKLARCWLAATLSEKTFKKTVKQTILESIKVVELCEEILRIVYGRGNMAYRLSLYHSAQLLYGAAKILFYQTKLLQDNLFTIKIQEVRSRDKRKFDSAFTNPEVPLFEIFDDKTTAPDLHLMTDDPLVEHMVQDELNFGALTDYEMEHFLLPQQEAQLLNEIRAFGCDQTQEIIEETVQVPPIDLNSLDVETIQIRMEILSTDNHDIPSEKSENRTNGTTKLPPKTPTKRRKISTEEIRCSQTPSSVNVSLLAHAEVSNRQVHIIEEEELILETRRGGIKFVDKEIKLSDMAMQRCITNVYAGTTSPRLHNTRFHSAEYYFQQSSTKIAHGGFGKQLAKLLSQHMITRPITDNEFTDIHIDSSLPALRHNDTVQAEAIREGHEREFDISSKIAVPITEINNNLPTAETVSLLEDLQSKLREAQIETSRNEIEKTLPALPEIAEIEVNIGPEVCPSPVHHQLQPTIETKIEKLLQTHWGEGTFAKFHEIIPSNTNTKLDAALAFQSLLDFHAKKRVVLKQARPFDTIWIEKPMESSEESEEINLKTLDG